MPTPRIPANEIEAYEWLLCGHLEDMLRKLRALPAEKWDWAPDVAAPTARILASHALQWLQSDRLHLTLPDPSKHLRIPEPPAEPAAMCDALGQETEEWRALLRGLTPERLDELLPHFETEPIYPVRWFVCHMIQNTIYKHGELATLYFTLGLDGTEPCAAPFPNAVYEECFGPNWAA